MSGKTYDFRISKPACVRAIEAYKKMEERMETEKENTECTFKLSDSWWEGRFKDSTSNSWNVFMNTGLFQQTYEKVKDMRGCLEEALPQINRLLARCEGFVDQLQSDSYVEPFNPSGDDSAEWNGGILALDYDYIPKISDLCDAILEKNTTLTMALTSVINDCASLLDGTDEDLQELTEASNMLKRIGNYKESFSLFASGVQDMNVDMMVRLKAIAEVEGVSDARFSEEEATLAAEYFTDYDDISTVQKIAEQIFEKDASEWSEAEIDFIAQTWDYAVQNGETDVIELYTKEMFVETYMELKGQKEGEELEQPPWKWDYYLKGDEKKIDLIMSHLDPKTQGTAYYTLNRLKYLQSDCLTISQKNSNLNRCGSYDISVEYADGSIQILINTSVGTGVKLKKSSYEAGLTLCDMNDVIDVNKERALKGLGYNSNDIENVRLSIISDTDILFAQEFYSQDYDSAFKVDPEYMSLKMLESVGKYMLKLEDLGPNTNNEELEKIINTLLYADTEHHPEQFTYYNERYLDLITAVLYDLSDRAVDKLNVGIELGLSDDELAQLVLEGREYYNQYSLWEAVRNIYNLDFEFQQIYFLKDARRDGNIHMQIGNLNGGIGENTDGAGCYSFDIYIMDEQNKSAYGEDHFHFTLEYPTAHAQINDEIKKKMKKLQEEREMILPNTALDIVKDLAGTIPGVEVGATVCSFGEDIGGMILSYIQIDQEIEEFKTKYEINNWGKYTCMQINFIKDGERVQKEDEIQYIGYQCAAPEIAYKIYLLQNYGFEFYLDYVIDSDKIPERYDDKEAYIKDIKKGMNTGEYSIEDINELFLENPVEAIRAADDAIAGADLDFQKLSDWLH